MAATGRGEYFARMKDSAGTARYLGIEGGGTQTTALFGDRTKQPVESAVFGPGNVRLLADRELEALFRDIAARFATPCGIGIGLAGARTESDRARIRAAAAQVWGETPVWVGHDLEVALAADLPTGGTDRTARCLVLSGTGSCCFARAADGRTVKQGGWGHILGDKGSGYEIGLRALKAIVYYFDRDGTWSDLGRRVLARLTLNEPEQLIDWVRKAEKHRIADLAVAVFESAARRDAIARDILEGAAHSLAKDAVSCATKLAGARTRVRFVLAGSVLTKQPAFAKAVAGLIRERRPVSETVVLDRPSVWGAWQMAIEAGETAETRAGIKRAKPSSRTPSIFVPGLSLERSPTEKRNPRSAGLDTMSTEAAVRLMLSEEQRSLRKLLRQSGEVAAVVDLIAEQLRRGGRLFYAGAGTSGRLGVLDASECPPTFRTEPDQVQGIIAGGETAITRAVEGAEDDAVAGAAAIRFRSVGRRDVVVGIAASGRTPFVWGALGEAKRRGAATVLLSFNPHLEIPRAARPKVVLAFDLGPEVLTGSTRLKCGTATKLLLNTFSTLSMVRLGKVMSNLMVDLNPSNEKLRARAVRIVQELTGAGEAEARAALERGGWRVQEAARRLNQALTARTSRAASSSKRAARRR